MNLQAKFTETRTALVSAMRVISQLQSENAKLKAELEKTTHEMWNDKRKWAESESSLAKCREALEKISKIMGGGCVYCSSGKIAKEALEESK